MTSLLLYLLAGIFVSITGALPLGAVNIAVINTSVKENIKKASYIIFAAGTGELFLALFALNFSKELSAFFQDNQWIQITFSIFFLSLGIYFILFKNQKQKYKNTLKTKLPDSKLITGFLLAILNPPVILYWILSISIVNKYIFELTPKIPLLFLLLFFFGIYLGKTGTLFFYGRWGNKMVQQKGVSKSKIFRVIGIVLVAISIFQSIKLFIELIFTFSIS